MDTAPQSTAPVPPPAAVRIARQLDCRGDLCPMPIYKAAQTLARMQPGEQLEILATDPGSVRDFPAFARQGGHVLVPGGSEEPGVYRFVIQKRGP